MLCGLCWIVVSVWSSVLCDNDAFVTSKLRSTISRQRPRFPRCHKKFGHAQSKQVWLISTSISNGRNFHCRLEPQVISFLPRINLSSSPPVVQDVSSLHSFRSSRSQVSRGCSWLRRCSWIMSVHSLEWQNDHQLPIILTDSVFHRLKSIVRLLKSIVRLLKSIVRLLKYIARPLKSSIQLEHPCRWLVVVALYSTELLTNLLTR